MRYAAWVPIVFRALAEAAPDQHSRVGLTAVSKRLGFGKMGWEDFAKHERPAQALVTAMSDLHDLGLVNFENVSHGNSVTADGRDVLAHGFNQILETLFDIVLSEPQRTFLARLYQHSRQEAEAWADLSYVDAEDVYVESGLATDELRNIALRLTFLGDLERKGLIRPESRAVGNTSYRSTYAAAAILTEEDPRFRARRAGVIDWSVPTPGFEAVEGRLADLKVALAAAVTDDDLSDVGRRCREIPADAIDVVFHPDMVPAGEAAPSRQDAEERLRLYLTARVRGNDHAEYRAFLRAALALANARTHSARTGPAAAVAAVQGLISFVRALQAIERASRLDSRAADSIVDA